MQIFKLISELDPLHYDHLCLMAGEQALETFVTSLLKECIEVDYERRKQEIPVCVKAIKTDQVETQANDFAGIGYEFFGEIHPCKSAAQTVVSLLETLCTYQKDFAPRYFEAIVEERNKAGRSRTFFTPNIKETIPNREHDLQLNSVQEVIPGWFVEVNENPETFRKYLELAFGIAGLEYGEHVKVWLKPNDLDHEIAILASEIDKHLRN